MPRNPAAKMVGSGTKDTSQGPASATPPVSQKRPSAKLDPLTGLAEHLAPRTFTVKKYYDTLSGTTSDNCSFHLKPQDEEFFITGIPAEVQHHFRDILNVIPGVTLSTLAGHGFVSHSVAWRVGKTVTTWGRWDEVVKVFSAKPHKEEIYNDLAVGLGRRGHPITKKKARSETFDIHEEKGMAAGEGVNTCSAAAEAVSHEQRSRSTSGAKSGNVAGDASPIETQPQTPMHPSISPRPTKRPRPDEPGTMFDRALKGFDHWRDTLREACRSSNDMTEEVAKLKADNARLEKEKIATQKENEALRAKATNSAELETELAKVKSEDSLLKADIEALQDLVGMWLAGVNVDNFLKEVREGKDVKGPFFAASMNK
ncbi:hypothetical protein EDD37DRAFT_607856 [Exophiala viscosa]|uniref:Uncharacterized protein n=1 Tax=Exophiala viscosa TaxID=2486360 RepID=A0AAN6IF48_9EURO|nr:hypothetical protein EDD36DRAFT_419356 [Exophiala viscosa]KAI1626284.1 hypothetical protein EDD37DRAFT_607856 [Exophiala viscosa]